MGLDGGWLLKVATVTRCSWSAEQIATTIPTWFCSQPGWEEEKEGWGSTTVGLEMLEAYTLCLKSPFQEIM